MHHDDINDAAARGLLDHLARQQSSGMLETITKQESAEGVSAKTVLNIVDRDAFP